MKNLFTKYLAKIVFAGMFLLMGSGAFANHINGIDLRYSSLGGLQYQVTLVVYGNCASGTFGSLATAVPVICIFDSSHYVASINLTLASGGVKVSNVCPRDTDSTTCTSLAYTIPGTEKYTYTGTYTLPSTAKNWRFVFTGQMGATPAGRVVSTNISGTTTIIYLEDSLNNLAGVNNSPDLTVIPTPYYCMNNADSYNPGGVDPDGDSLSYSLVSARTNGGAGCSTAPSNVTYVAGYSGTNPLHYTAGTFNFNSTTGTLSFTPDLTGTYTVVYNVREYRSGTIVGTSQREMYFLVQACSLTPPKGVISGATIGTIVDSVDYSVCSGSGVFSFQINPTEPDTSNSITMTAIGVPAWATFTIINNGTNHPTSIFSGNSSTVAPGVYAFSVTFGDNNCPISGSNTVAYYVTIANVPNPVTCIKDSVCVGSSVTYSDASTGGTWSSSSAAIATVNATGVVTGIGAGAAFITYSSAAGCFKDTAINVMPLPAAITGTLNVCVGNTTTLTETTPGVTWSSSNTGIATVSSSGVVTGVSVGNATITCVLSTGCAVTAVVTVNPLPSAITATATSVCVGSTINYSDASAGGTWSTSAATVATVSTTGVVTGVAGGVATISYAFGTGCAVTKLVTVNPLPSAIAGSTSVCIGMNISLTDATAGGTWTSGTTTVATVNATGVVTGIATGTSVITYTLPTGCLVTSTITVVGLPAAITGALSVCVGATSTLADATPGGTWSTSNAAIAPIIGTGVVTGGSAGNATITYTVGTGCYVTANVTVNPVPAAIGGVASVCAGSTTNLTDATGGGTWSSTPTTTATITAGGVVTGVAAGNATIDYTLATGCFASVIVTINTQPAAITGTLSVCNGATTNLADVTAGGTWSSVTTTVATISGTGVVTGTGVGTSLISYAIGSCVSTATVTVNVSPAPITGSGVICVGSTSPLADATVGGTWSSVTTTVATITAGGIVTGVAVGNSVISYTIGSCAATKIVTVNTAPAPITGTLTVCNGFTTNLADVVPGGTWTSTTPAIATISGTGVVTGAGVGTDLISYGIGTCYVTATVTVNVQPAPITGTFTICNLTSTLLSDATVGGTWSSITPAVATITAGGTVTGVSVGTSLISYTIGSCAATVTETITALPNAGAITGLGTVCAGSNILLTDGVAGGTWSSATPAIATVVAGSGLVSGVTAGVDSIYYSVTNTCGTAVAGVQITVNPLPVAGSISGPNTVCMGSLITLLDGAAGGTWSAANGNATVAGGIVTGVSGGTDIISYSVTNGCGTANATYPITVNVAPTAGFISGPSTICQGTFTILTDAASGGVWSSSNATATVSGTGVVTGMAGGVDTISYSVVNPCGVAIATKIITINPLPVGAPITGPASVCVSATINLSDAIAGGTWHVTNTHASISGTGVVTGVSAGIDTIYYSLTNSCGTTNDSTYITVNPLPNPGTITGSSTVCVGSFITLTDPAAGGTFSISNTNASIVPATGVVTGVNAGMDTVTYTVVNVCGTATTDKVITVVPVPSSGVISGPSSVCVASNITLTNSVPGGVWSARNGDATITAGGIVTGVVAGLDTIIYTLTTVCGTLSDSAFITVNPLPASGSITGDTPVCVGSLITLVDVASGGVWSASNGNATVSAAGSVVGVNTGRDTISYSVTNVCGTAIATAIVTINAFPSAGVISGTSTVCVGLNVTLSETASGGVWSSSSGLATVSAGGIVTGVTAGTDTISYTVTNSCGVVGTFILMTILPLPNPGTISGPTSVCLGGTIALTDPVVGGTWSSVTPTIATVSGTGTVTGVAAGIDTIKYSLSGVCGTFSADYVVSVVTFPTAGTISGPTSVCDGAAITLLDGITGGTWSPSNANATLIAPGIISGAAVGIDTIFYSVTNACGTAITSTIITINPTPVVAAISGSSNICVGAVATLADATASGTWTSSNTSVATIDLISGLMSGIAAGTTIVSYTVTNSFGCPGFATMAVTVNTPPVTPAITGVTHECVGGNTTLNDAIAGGTWASSNTALATVAGGIVNGVSAGVVTISYTVINICGSSTVTTSDTVIALPVVAAITGTTSGCVGASNALADATSGGLWSSSSVAVATIGSTGVVTGVSAGTTVISYTVTNSSGCSSVVTVNYTVNPLPVIAPITGVTNECIGLSQTLADATSGGTWSSSNTSIATVNSSGMVTGVSGGIATISYSTISAMGCTGFVTVSDTVNTYPTSMPITGTMQVCIGSQTTLSDATPYGSWSSANTTLATVNPSNGVVTGVAAGSVVMLYSVVNSCGSVTDSAIVTVNNLPVIAPISGPSMTVCAGATTLLTDATSGGVWSSGNPAIATVNSTGLVTGIAAGSVTISYTVTDALGCVSSATDNVSFGSSIGTSSVLPTAGTLCHGMSVYMHVVTSGSGLTYQWLHNGAPIAGATNYFYNADSVGSYSVIIGNGTCEETLSGPNVNVSSVPVINFTAPNVLYTGSYTTYQWYHNGSAIPGAVYSIYHETMAGSYFVVVTETGGCTDTSANFVISGSGGGGGGGTGSSAVPVVNGNENIRLYPNPATSTLNVDAPFMISIQIISPDGKIWMEQKDTKEIGVSSLSDGMYIIKIYDNNGILVKTDKFMKLN